MQETSWLHSTLVKSWSMSRTLKSYPESTPPSPEKTTLVTAREELLLCEEVQMQCYLMYDPQTGGSSKLCPVSGSGQPLQIISGMRKSLGFSTVFTPGDVCQQWGLLSKQQAAVGDREMETSRALHLPFTSSEFWLNTSNRTSEQLSFHNNANLGHPVFMLQRPCCGLEQCFFFWKRELEAVPSLAGGGATGSYKWSLSSLLPVNSAPSMDLHKFKACQKANLDWSEHRGYLNESGS